MATDKKKQQKQKERERRVAKEKLVAAEKRRSLLKEESESDIASSGSCGPKDRQSRPRWRTADGDSSSRRQLTKVV
jgi:hypothetical protein